MKNLVVSSLLAAGVLTSSALSVEIWEEIVYGYARGSATTVSGVKLIANIPCFYDYGEWEIIPQQFYEVPYIPRASMIVRWKGKIFILRDVYDSMCFMDFSETESLIPVNCGFGTGMLIDRGLKTAWVDWCIEDYGTGNDMIYLYIETDDGEIKLDINESLRKGDFKVHIEPIYRDFPEDGDFVF